MTCNQFTLRSMSIYSKHGASPASCLVTAGLVTNFATPLLQEAGISVKLAPTIGIAVDHRRRNRSLEGLQVCHCSMNTLALTACMSCSGHPACPCSTHPVGAQSFCFVLPHAADALGLTLVGCELAGSAFWSHLLCNLCRKIPAASDGVRCAVAV